MATYLRLFDPTQQFQLKNGALNVSGRLYVYLEGTDDYADLYDENGSQLQQPVVLDNNGRSAGLFVDSKKTYWMKVNDQYDGTVFTIRKMTPCGGGGGSVLSGTYNVISSDQSVNIEKSVDAGNTTFDLSVSDDGNDLLEWIRCDGDSAIRCTDIRKPVYTEGTMEVGYQGIKLIRGHYYHVTAHVRATKNAEREPWYDTIRMYFSLYYGQNNIVDVTSQSQIIDYSLGLTQEYEISTDVIPEFDCELLFQIAGQDLLTGGDVELVDIEAHRIYSGSPSIPSGVLSRAQAAEQYQPLLTAGDNISISASGVIAATNSQQVQSNWTETDTTSDSYIQNKPNVPSIVKSTATLPPVDTNISTLKVMSNGRVLGDSSELGLLAPTGSQADAGKVLTLHYSGSPGTTTAQWDALPLGDGRLMSHTAELYLHHTVNSFKEYHVRNVKNNCLNHVAVENLQGQICNLVIEAPTLESGEEYSYTVQFDCVNSSGGCDVTVENAAPKIITTYGVDYSSMYLRVVGSDTASDAINKEIRVVESVTPNSQIIKDGDGNNTSVVYSVGQTNKWLRITNAAYYGVSQYTALAGPLVVTDVSGTQTKTTDRSVDFDGSPVSQVRVHGNVWEMVRF